MGLQAELALDCKAALGEGPVWDPDGQALYWVDIENHTVNVFTPANGENRAINVGQQVGAVVPRRSGGAVLALRDGFAFLDLESEAITAVGDPESDQPNNRFNDGKCDPAGRFWAGTMSDQGKAEGSLYCLEADRSISRKADGITCSNGLAWTADARTMYYIDTMTRQVCAFDYDCDTGAIENRRAVVTVPQADGLPDGMSIDAEDMIWVAHWGGSRVTRYDPATGKVLQTIEVPASQTTSSAFGGPDYRHLYITSARVDLDDEALASEPHAGGLFVAEVDVPGPPAVAYAG